MRRDCVTGRVEVSNQWLGGRTAGQARSRKAWHQRSHESTRLVEFGIQC